MRLTRITKRARTRRLHDEPVDPPLRGAAPAADRDDVLDLIDDVLRDCGS